VGVANAVVRVRGLDSGWRMRARIAVVFGEYDRVVGLHIEVGDRDAVGGVCCGDVDFV
jgi:hypothetical protein